MVTTAKTKQPDHAIEATRKRSRNEMEADESVPILHDPPILADSSNHKAPAPLDQRSRSSQHKNEEDDEEEDKKPAAESKQEDSDDEEEAPVPPAALKAQFARNTEQMNGMNPEDAAKFQEADARRIKDERAVRSAHSKLLKAKSEAAKAQARYDECQRVYAEVKAKAELNLEKNADALLLEPTPWNTYYQLLKHFYDRKGHCNFKRTVTEADIEGLMDEEERELRTLSWWTCRQRKFKRRGELEQYKIHLLNRLDFEWNPQAGPGPEKWMKSFALLKQYKEFNGHVKVPIKHIESGFKLGSWLKTQVTQYRNTQEGRQPALCPERIRLLEDLGVTWGQKRLTTSWDSRFEDLLDFKRRFGHVNVPWQWKENVSLAQWVNSQRKKYKDLTDGKRNNLSEAQINRLNGIGFKWSTGGRGRYNHNTEVPANPITPALPAKPSTANPAPAEPRVAAVPPPPPNHVQENQYPPHPHYLHHLHQMDPQALNEHYAQRFAHQNNDPNLAYFQYAYHMNQLNNQFNKPGNGVANGHPAREQMNQVGTSWDESTNGQSSAYSRESSGQSNGLQGGEGS